MYVLSLFGYVELTQMNMKLAQVPYTRVPVTSNMERATGFTFSQRRQEDNLRIWRVA